MRGLIEYRDYAILCAVLKLIEIFLSKADPSLQNNIKMLKLFLTWNYSVKKKTETKTNKQTNKTVTQCSMYFLFLSSEYEHLANTNVLCSKEF